MCEKQKKNILHLLPSFLLSEKCFQTVDQSVFLQSHHLLVGTTQTHSSPFTVQLWLSWVSQKLSLVFNSTLSLTLGLSIFLHFISFSVRSPNLSICSVLLKALHMFVHLPKRVFVSCRKRLCQLSIFFSSLLDQWLCVEDRKE